MSSQDLFSQSPLKKKRKELNKLQIIKEKKKLKEEINELKLLRTEINKSLDYYKRQSIFNQIYNDQNRENIMPKNLTDVVVTWKDELFRFSGMRCTKFDVDGEYEFEFISSRKNSKRGTCFVQIFMVEGEGILGKWKMPILLDPNDILSKNPINNFRQVKRFVMLCKHYLYCQENRETQFETLKAHIEQLKSCSVGGNREIFTSIQLQIFKLQEIETGNFYDIILYIVYELNEVRPYKLIADSFRKEPLPENVVQKLNTYFKIFKRYELNSAFEKVVNEQNNNLFRWEIIFENIDHVIESDEDESARLSEVEREGNLSNLNEEENESKKKKKSAVKEKKTNPDLEEKNFKANKKGNQNLRNRANLKKVAFSENSQSEENVEKVRETKKGERSKKVNKSRLEEEERIGDKNDAEEGNTTKQIKMKNRKVTETSVKSGKQTKLDFFRRDDIGEAENLNSQTKELGEQDKNKEILKKNKSKNNPKPQASQSKQEIEEKDHPGKKGKDPIKKTFDLSNFVIRRKERNLSKLESPNSATFLKQISLDGNPSCSTPIPGKKQSHAKIDTEISEIIPKSPGKRSRSDSSDSELDGIVEEPNQSLLESLEEIERKISQAEYDKKKRNRNFKGSKKGSKKSRKV